LRSRKGVSPRWRVVYYPLELFGEQAGSVSRFWKHLERFLLTSVIDALITQNDRRAEVYRGERRARVDPVVVHNYKPAAPAAPRSGKLRSLLGLGGSEKVVLYEGVLVHGRWLDRLIGSARHLPEGVVRVLMGETMPWWEREGRHLLANPLTAGNIRIAPFVPHEELPGYVADADAGVIIYDDSVRNNYFCEPGKLSDYVRAGVPVVAPDFPTLGPVVRKYKIGCTFSAPHPETIAHAITRVLGTPSFEWAPGLRAAASELVWETQVDAFLNAVTGEPIGGI
jgi:glycosyltransferase involved in cell wall biosynthesis